MNPEAHIVDLYIPKYLKADNYYNIWSAILRNNQRRWNDIKLEKKLVTQSWCQGVNPGTSGVSVFNTYNVETQYLAYEETSNELLYDFTEDMIDNDL